mmetsp:Transcript_14215/g.38800  ORF Transcript_14215/g.38800 Transcript_14215/m.38800 type:complete len:111 (-) Transcript_14215:162-494(-)
MAPKEDEGKNIVEYLIAGGTAGMVSRTVIAPIERVKILFQISKAGTCSTTTQYWHYVPKIYKEEGLIGFWKGNGAAVIRVVPYMVRPSTSLSPPFSPKYSCRRLVATCTY